MIDVCLLGTGGTIPLPRRRLSATLVRVGGDLVLLDCGEGTQVALRERGWGLRRLRPILITHTHADHVLGLPGLLLSLGFSGRGSEEPLTIYGPPPLEKVLGGLLVVESRLPYPLRIVTLSTSKVFPLEGTGGIEASCTGVEHDVPCLAYSLSVPRAPRFNAERAHALGLPVTQWGQLQSGQSVQFAGRTIEPGEVLGPNRRGLRLVLVTDATLTPSIVEFVRAGGEGADLLIAEGMYGSEEDKPTRWESLHMTFAEAATLARDGDARRLWLTHYGPSLDDPSAHLGQATTVFPATVLGQDGMTQTLGFDE
ncbi:MAG: ribonuclease Z [Rubrobacter sp.]|nr:ribonuclease Z [Rubrobacter sp.]